MTRRAALPVAVSTAVLLALTGCGGHTNAGGDWPLPNLDLSSTRALLSSGINRSNVTTLHIAWRFRLPIPPGESGALTATPVVAGGTVYLQDMKSNVYALDLATGRTIWVRRFNDTNPGPNGVAVAGNRVYGATDTSVFALNRATGRVLWKRFIVTVAAPYVDVAPQVADGLVYAATTGSTSQNGRGFLYAVDAATGRLRWSFDTIKGTWHVPSLAGGGGAWYTPSVAGGQVFWGTANPYPYGGSPKYPNGGAYAGPALYTDSLLALDAQSGKLDWYDQVTRHDVRDYDFEVPPILGTIGSRQVVWGAGKAGRVIAWDRKTHARVWTATVGVHRNDTGLLPRHLVTVCPGLLGGVETPMAYDGSVLYVPVVDLCMSGSSVGYEDLDKVNVTARGDGELVALDAATGHRVWKFTIAQADFGCATVANGVVFTTSFDGGVYGIDTADGKLLWEVATRAGINSCPALAGNTLLVGAGVPLGHRSVLELTAYTLGKGS